MNLRDVVFSDAEIGQLDEVADVLADLPDSIEAEIQRLKTCQLVNHLWNLKQKYFFYWEIRIKIRNLKSKHCKTNHAHFCSAYSVLY